MSVQGRSEILLSWCHPPARWEGPVGGGPEQIHLGPLLCEVCTRTHPVRRVEAGNWGGLWSPLVHLSQRGARGPAGVSQGILVTSPPLREVSPPLFTAPAPRPFYYCRYTRKLFVYCLYCCFMHKKEQTFTPLGEEQF